MKEFPRKFLSLRDKNGTGRRSKSVAPAPSVPAIPDGTGNKSKVCFLAYLDLLLRELSLVSS